MKYVPFELTITRMMIEMKKELPDIHKQAFMFKNSKRFQHDGGRAWIKDSQLQEARKDGNGKLTTIQRKEDPNYVEEPEAHKPLL
jgi:hypothetical protein